MKKENVVKVLVMIESCFWRALPMNDRFVDFYCQELANIPDEDVEAIIDRIKDLDDIPENIVKTINEAYSAVRLKKHIAKAVKDNLL